MNKKVGNEMIRVPSLNNNVNKYFVYICTESNQEIMSAAQVKEELHRYIDLADSRMAEALLAMFKNYFAQQKEEVVAYTTKGQPLTKAQIIKEVMSAVNDVEKGNYYTTEELRKKLKKQ